jgi:hypothetical protein
MDEIVHRAKKIMKAIDMSPKQRKQTSNNNNINNSANNFTCLSAEKRITKTTNNDHNKIDIEASTTTTTTLRLIKEENKTLRVEINKLRNEMKLKDNRIEELKVLYPKNKQ